MTRKEWRKNRRYILRNRNAYDDTGMYFWYFEMLMRERDHTIRMVKRCAKQALKETTSGDEYWKTHQFMTLLGKHVNTELRKDPDCIWADKMGPP